MLHCKLSYISVKKTPLRKISSPIFHWAQTAPTGYRDRSPCRSVYQKNVFFWQYVGLTYDDICSDYRQRMCFKERCVDSENTYHYLR